MESPGMYIYNILHYKYGKSWFSTGSIWITLKPGGCSVKNRPCGIDPQKSRLRPTEKLKNEPIGVCSLKKSLHIYIYIISLPTPLPKKTKTLFGWF